MTEQELYKLRFPVGEFKVRETTTEEEFKSYVQDLEELPAKLRKEVEGLTEEQLDTPYRPDGWTIRQVVHHLPDSHANGYIRFKLAVTEDGVKIQPYLEPLWANLEDGKKAPIEMSLKFLEGLHQRWVMFLKSLKPQDYKRKLFHPEHNKELPFAGYLGAYAWHCKHHLAHITELKKRKGW